MGSNKLPKLGTRSYAFSCSFSALLHPVQTRLSLSIPSSLHLSTFLVYADDLIITGSDPSIIDTIIRQLDS